MPRKKCYKRSTFFFFWPLVLERLIDEENSERNFPLVCKEWRETFQNNERARFGRFLFSPKRESDLLFLVFYSLIRDGLNEFFIHFETLDACYLIRHKDPKSLVELSFGHKERQYPDTIEYLFSKLTNKKNGTSLKQVYNGKDVVVKERTLQIVDYANLLTTMGKFCKRRNIVPERVTIRQCTDSIFEYLEEMEIKTPDKLSHQRQIFQSPLVVLQQLKGSQKKIYIQKLYVQLSKMNVNKLLW